MNNSGRDYDLQDMCWRWTFDDIHLEQRLQAVERTLFEEYAKMNEKDSVTTVPRNIVLRYCVSVIT